MTLMQESKADSHWLNIWVLFKAVCMHILQCKRKMNSCSHWSTF